MPGKNKNTVSDAARDRQTMEALYEAYEQKMFGIARAILNNEWQAEDAVQEAFIRMVRYLPKCRDVHSLKTKTLIVRVIKSAAIDIYRKNKRESVSVPIEENTWIEDKHNAIESYLSSVSVESLLQKIDRQLPDSYKDVVRLRCYYGLPIAEISKVLGISEDNVYQRLSRARKTIKNLMGDEADVEEKLG